MARYLKNVETDEVTPVSLDDDITAADLLSQVGDDGHPLYEEVALGQLASPNGDSVAPAYPGAPTALARYALRVDTAGVAYPTYLQGLFQSPAGQDAEPFLTSATVPPATYGAGGILNVANSTDQAVTGLALDQPDPYVLTARIIVFDDDATNTLEVTAHADDDGDGTVTLDWTTADTGSISGSDLSWDGATAVVSSEAGGAYAVSVTLTGAADD